MLQIKFLWNCSQNNATDHFWWEVSFGLGNGLELSGNKPLPEQMLTSFMSPYICPLKHSSESSLILAQWCSVKSGGTLEGYHMAIEVYFSSRQLKTSRVNYKYKYPMFLQEVLSNGTYVFLEDMSANGTFVNERLVGGWTVRWIITSKIHKCIKYKWMCLSHLFLAATKQL